jgi:hypothetical protein
MMTHNVGTTEKVIRIILGIALLSLIYFMEGSMRWVGLVGAVLIVTALIGWCPISAVLGINTAKQK